MNNDCIKGEEDESVFSGSRIQRYFINATLYPLQYLNFISKLMPRL